MVLNRTYKALLIILLKFIYLTYKKYVQINMLELEVYIYVSHMRYICSDSHFIRFSQSIISVDDRKVSYKLIKKHIYRRDVSFYSWSGILQPYT